MDRVQEARYQEQTVEDKLRQVEELFIFRDEERIRNFLREHPELLGFLPEAYAQVQKYFGANTQIALELVTDPEIVAPEELFAYILTSLSIDDGLAQLHRLAWEWFLDQPDWGRERFNFDLEFIWDSTGLAS